MPGRGTGRATGLRRPAAPAPAASASRGGLRGYFLHGPAGPPPAVSEQMLLFAQEQQPTARPVVDVAALRTDLQALELTAEQLGCLSRTGSPGG